MQISITADFRNKFVNALVFLHGLITMTCLILVFICEGIAGHDPEDIIADFGSWLIFSNVSDLTNSVDGLLILPKLRFRYLMDFSYLKISRYSIDVHVNCSRTAKPWSFCLYIFSPLKIVNQRSFAGQLRPLAI